MVKINPGSKKMWDNDTKTHTARAPHEDLPEPIMTPDGKYECPLCHEIFKKREEYLSHGMARHRIEESVAAGDQDQL